MHKCLLQPCPCNSITWCSLAKQYSQCAFYHFQFKQHLPNRAQQQLSSALSFSGISSSMGGSSSFVIGLIGFGSWWCNESSSVYRKWSINISQAIANTRDFAMISFPIIHSGGAKILSHTSMHWKHIWHVSEVHEGKSRARLHLDSSNWKKKPMQQFVSDLRPLTFKRLNYLTADQISQQTRQA